MLWAEKHSDFHPPTPPTRALMLQPSYKSWCSIPCSTFSPPELLISFKPRRSESLGKSSALCRELISSAQTAKHQLSRSPQIKPLLILSLSLPCHLWSNWTELTTVLNIHFVSPNHTTTKFIHIIQRKCPSESKDIACQQSCKSIFSVSLLTPQIPSHPNISLFPPSPPHSHSLPSRLVVKRLPPIFQLLLISLLPSS